jgi:hypothetical protein
MMERVSQCCHRRHPGTGEPGVLPQRSADEWPANTRPTIERAKKVLPQKAPRYRGARGPTTKTILSYHPNIPHPKASSSLHLFTSGYVDRFAEWKMIASQFKSSRSRCVETQSRKKIPCPPNPLTVSSMSTEAHFRPFRSYHAGGYICSTWFGSFVSQWLQLQNQKEGHLRANMGGLALYFLQYILFIEEIATERKLYTRTSVKNEERSQSSFVYLSGRRHTGG